MITQKEINNACEHLRIVATVSDDLIEFMREASIAKLAKETQEDVEIDKDVKMLNKKFGVKAIEEIAKMCIENKFGIDDVADFVNYRNKIKKPLKTERPLKIFIQELIKIKNAGYDVKQSIKIMKDYEWQTLNIEWITKKIPKQGIKSDLAQFGFNNENKIGVIK